jgi:hypothetical protein
MLLGGVAVDDRLVQKLAATLDRSLRGKLDQALLFRAKVIGLTNEEKAAILYALETAPAELQGVRDLLMADGSWRLRERL